MRQSFIEQDLEPGECIWHWVNPLFPVVIDGHLNAQVGVTFKIAPEEVEAFMAQSFHAVEIRSLCLNAKRSRPVVVILLFAIAPLKDLFWTWINYHDPERPKPTMGPLEALSKQHEMSLQFYCGERRIRTVTVFCSIDVEPALVQCRQIGPWTEEEYNQVCQRLSEFLPHPQVAWELSQSIQSRQHPS